MLLYCDAKHPHILQGSSHVCCCLLAKRSNTILGGHPFSTFAKFSRKLTFFPSDTHTYVYMSVG